MEIQNTSVETLNHLHVRRDFDRITVKLLGKREKAVQWERVSLGGKKGKKFAFSCVCTHLQKGKRNKKCVFFTNRKRVIFPFKI